MTTLRRHGLGSRPGTAASKPPCPAVCETFAALFPSGVHRIPGLFRTLHIHASGQEARAGFLTVATRGVVGNNAPVRQRQEKKTTKLSDNNKVRVDVCVLSETRQMCLQFLILAKASRNLDLMLTCPAFVFGEDRHTSKLACS